MANSIIKGCGYHHIALRASDYDKSYRFYTEGLGFSLLTGWGEGDKRICMLDMGDGTILELFAGGTDCGAVNENGAGNYFHLAFHVDDVQAAFDRAIAFGATEKSAPSLGGTLQASPHVLHIDGAFVFGPDKEILEFFKLNSMD